MLVNFAHMFIFTTAPGYLQVTSVSAAYNVLASTEGDAQTSPVHSFTG